MPHKYDLKFKFKTGGKSRALCHKARIFLNSINSWILMNFYPIFTLIPYFCRTFVVFSENHKFEVGQLHQTSLKSLKT